MDFKIARRLPMDPWMPLVYRVLLGTVCLASVLLFFVAGLFNEILFMAKPWEGPRTKHCIGGAPTNFFGSYLQIKENPYNLLSSIS